MLDEPGFNGAHIRNMEKLIVNIPMCKQFPMLRSLALKLPMPIAQRVAPGFAYMAAVCVFVFVFVSCFPPSLPNYIC